MQEIAVVEWLMDQNPFFVIYWSTLCLGVALALFGWVMHRFEPHLMRWKARVDREMAEAAIMARQRRAREARGDEAMEQTRAIAAAELAKVWQVRRLASVVDPPQCAWSRR